MMSGLMMSGFSWLSPGVIQALGWTLIHFLWEGLALALFFQLVQPLCRSAHARYVLAFNILLAMACAPVLTYFAIRSLAPVSGGEDAAVLGGPAFGPWDMTGDVLSPATSASPWLNWLVVLWFTGVALLSLRVAGGWYVADSLRRRHTSPLPVALVERCEILRLQLAISRPVRFLQSALVASPAVVGWLRPVVLVPASAVIGLTAAQLEAVIIHELAHIRRLDALANLVQMAVETVLFYHPAVWWISRRIRIEREHCCDDVAVSLSGDALGYAKALASLEEWRAPAPALAASGGVLKQRISRLLGLNMRTNAVSAVGIASIGLVCLAGCVVAHGADVDAGPQMNPSLSAPAPEAPPEPLVPPPAMAVIPVPPLPPVNIAARDEDRDSIRDAERRAREMEREVLREQAERDRDLAETAREQAREQQRALDSRGRGHGEAPRPEDASFVAALGDAGLPGLDAREVAALKSVGITPEYVRAITASGFHAGAAQMLSLKSQGIGADYIKGLRDAGLDPSLSQIVGLHAQGVAATYVRDIHAAWPEASASQIIALKARGVSADYVRAVRAGWPGVSLKDVLSMQSMGVSANEAADFKRLGMNDLSVHEMVSYKAVGVTPEYTRSLQAAGLKLDGISARDLTAFKATGVTPDLVKALQNIGLKDLSAHDYVTAKVRGLTPEFLDAVRNHNFTNLSMRQLIAFKDADVF